MTIQAGFIAGVPYGRVTDDAGIEQLVLRLPGGGWRHIPMAEVVYTLHERGSKIAERSYFRTALSRGFSAAVETLSKPLDRIRGRRPRSGPSSTARLENGIEALTNCFRFAR